MAAATRPTAPARAQASPERAGTTSMRADFLQHQDDSIKRIKQLDVKIVAARKTGMKHEPLMELVHERNRQDLSLHYAQALALRQGIVGYADIKTHPKEP